MPDKSAQTQSWIGPIQLIPPGLMGLLQLKQGGQLPSMLSKTVAPVVELRDWYLTARRVDELALFGGVPTVSLPSIGSKPFVFGGNNATVPAGQIWWVEQMTIQVTGTGAIVATDLLRYAPGIIPGTGGALSQAVAPPTSDYLLVARSRAIRAELAPRGFWAFPGDTFAALVDDVVTTNGWTAQLGLRATPCLL